MPNDMLIDDHGINTQLALTIHGRAVTIAHNKAVGAGIQSYGADEISQELEILLKPYFLKMNLTNNTDYQAILKKVNEWDPPGNDQIELQKYGMVQNVLINLLPCWKNEAEKEKQAVEILTKECETCEKHLRKIISAEALKLPKSGTHYRDIASLKNGDDAFNVSLLATDITAKTGHFSEKEPNNYFQYASRELIKAANCFVATVKLKTALTDKTKNNADKLSQFNKEYKRGATQTALQSNPDPHIKRFFTKIGYYLANFFTAGLVHFLTKGSPLMSAPQKLHKRAGEIIGDKHDSHKKRTT